VLFHGKIIKTIINMKFFSKKINSFGLDLSDLSIKIIDLKKAGSALALAGFGRQEIPEGIIENGEIKKKGELIKIIAKTVKESKGGAIKSKDCVVSLPETESYIRVIQLPEMKNEEIKEAIKWELEANIPVAVEDVYFDWQILNFPSKRPNELCVLIGALPKTLVDPYLDVIKKAGLNPLAFEIESIATARAVIKEGEQSNPVIIVDLGAKRASFIIFAVGSVWLTTSLPISNNLLIDDIASAFKISKEEARDLKFKVGLDKEKDEKIYQAMEPRLAELVKEIKKYMDYYETLLPKYLPKTTIDKILLCGGGANLEGLPLFLSPILKIHVELANPWINIFDAEAKKLPELSFSDSLSYTTAIGLALRGILK
jgi:type IV pilus assembly protein PilM